MNRHPALAPALVATFSLLLLASVFAMSSTVDEDLNNRVVRSLYDLAYTDSQLVREVVAHQDSRQRSYDGLVNVANALQRSFADLREVFEGSPYLAATTAALDTFTVLIDQREEAVEQFKSRNSTYKNSLARMPSLIAQLGHCHEQPALSDEIRQSCGALHQLLLTQVTAPTTSQGDLIERELAHLTRVGAAYEEAVGLGQLTAHVPVLVRTSKERLELVAAILNLPSSASIRLIHTAYESSYSDRYGRTNAVRWLLFVVCCCLVPACAAAVLKQRMLNRSLDQKVSQRTHDLTILNDQLRLEVAQRQTSQRSMAEAQQQLVQSSKLVALGEMAGGVAHEINTPIGVVLLRIDHVLRCLLSEPPRIAKAVEFCGVIRDTATHMGRIISGLRTFSRSADDDPFVPVKVADLIAQSVILCTERFTHHGVALEVEGSADDASILCRPAQVSQVLVNLLNNAFDAVREQPAPQWIRVSLSQASGFAQIVVVDSGPGIAVSVRDKMFQPFFTTKELGQGTGLGLSISHGIVKHHGGILELDPTHSNTCFLIKIPLLVKDSEAPKEPLNELRRSA